MCERIFVRKDDTTVYKPRCMLERNETSERIGVRRLKFQLKLTRRPFAIGAFFNTPQSKREMCAGMPRAARRPTYSVNSVNLVKLDLMSSRSLFTPLGSENSLFFNWSFTKMAVSMVSCRESEQELKESHLMLKNSWLYFRISSSFVGNNHSLQIH